VQNDWASATEVQRTERLRVLDLRRAVSPLREQLLQRFNAIVFNPELLSLSYCELHDRVCEANQLKNVINELLVVGKTDAWHDVYIPQSYLDDRRAHVFSEAHQALGKQRDALKRASDKTALKAMVKSCKTVRVRFSATTKTLSTLRAVQKLQTPIQTQKTH
jgi:hypothetical protein